MEAVQVWIYDNRVLFDFSKVSHVMTEGDFPLTVEEVLGLGAGCRCGMVIDSLLSGSYPPIEEEDILDYELPGNYHLNLELDDSIMIDSVHQAERFFGRFIVDMAGPEAEVECYLTFGSADECALA